MWDAGSGLRPPAPLDGTREVIPAGQTGTGRATDNSGDVLGTLRQADGTSFAVVWTWKPEHYQR